MKNLFILFFSAVVFHLHAQPAAELVKTGLELDSAEEYAQAIEKFSQALEQEPDNAVIWFNRGISHMNFNQAGLAIVDFNKAILLDTTLMDAYFNRSLAQHITGDYQFALADISHYLQQFPKDTIALEHRIALAWEMKEYEQAQSDLEKLYSITNNPKFALQLAEVSLSNKDYAIAESALSGLIQYGYADSLLYMRRAVERHLAGNYQGSLSDIQLFELNAPVNSDAEKLKGDNYFFLKQFSDAANIFEKLLRTDSSNADLLADYGHCLLQLEQYADAEKILTRSIRAKNDAPAYAYLGRGIARFNMGMGDKACEDWAKSFKLGETGAKNYLDSNCKKETTDEKR